MSLNKNEVNALNVLGMRKLNFIPDHFEKIYLTHKVNIKSVENWIEYYLNSRYAIKINLMLDSNKKIIYGTKIGLEDPNEMLLLTLGCTHLHKKEI